jgi:hypothetical protein
MWGGGDGWGRVGWGRVMVGGGRGVAGWAGGLRRLGGGGVGGWGCWASCIICHQLARWTVCHAANSWSQVAPNIADSRRLCIYSETLTTADSWSGILKNKIWSSQYFVNEQFILMSQQTDVPYYLGQQTGRYYHNKCWSWFPRPINLYHHNKQLIQLTTKCWSQIFQQTDDLSL